MKMITKVFLVIAVLLICLIAWVLFLGGDGVIPNAWNGIANSVNTTWKTLTGSSNGIVPEWHTGTNLGDAQKDLEGTKTNGNTNVDGN